MRRLVGYGGGGEGAQFVMRRFGKNQWSIATIDVSKRISERGRSLRPIKKRF